MDRGVKIAIFVASIVSLGLGLVWDQVLSNARNVISDERPDVLGPERVEARIGAPGTPRAQPPAPAAEAPKTPSAEEKPAPAVEVKAPALDTTYVLVAGDNPWKLAHQRFKDRKLSTDDIVGANPGAKWRPGETIVIPAGKK